MLDISTERNVRFVRLDKRVFLKGLSAVFSELSCRRGSSSEELNTTTASQYNQEI